MNGAHSAGRTGFRRPRRGRLPRFEADATPGHRLAAAWRLRRPRHAARRGAADQGADGRRLPPASRSERRRGRAPPGLAPREGAVRDSGRRVRLLDLATFGRHAHRALQGRHRPRPCGARRAHEARRAGGATCPPGAAPPLVVPRGIDDVPVVGYTLWSTTASPLELRQVAQELRAELVRHPQVAQVTVLGGVRRAVTVRFDRERLAAHQVSILQVHQALAGLDWKLPAGSFSAGNVETEVEVGALFHTADEVGAAVIAVYDGRPVYLRDVATVTDGADEPAQYVWMTGGAAGAAKGLPAGLDTPAVTLAIAKKPGTNAVRAGHRARRPDGPPARTGPPRQHRGHQDARLRRDRRREVERAHEAPRPRHDLRRPADGGRPRPARGGRRRRRGAGDARPDARLLLPLRLHAQPRHPLRAHLRDRHPGRRRHRRRREHPSPLSTRLDEPAARDHPRHRRSRQPDDPRHLHGHRRSAAARLRLRAHGPVHAADSDQRLRRDAVLAGRRLRRLALAHLSPLQEARHGARRTQARRRERPARYARPRDSAGRPPPSPLPAALPAAARKALATLGAARRSRGAARRLDDALPAAHRGGEDAAARQQERAPGGRRHARGDDSRAHRRGGARARPGLARPAGGDRHRDLRRNLGAVQFQRAGAALLPALRAAGRRPAGEPAAQARPRDRQSSVRQVPAPAPRPDRRAARRQRQGDGGSAGAAGALDPGGRDLRPDRRRAPRPRRPGEGDLREAPKVSSTSTGSSKARARGSISRSTARRPRAPASHRRRSPGRSGSRSPAPMPRTSPIRVPASRCRSCCASTPRSAPAPASFWR